MDAEIVVTPDAEALASEAARRFADLARQAIEYRGRFSAALSGGSTPAALYKLLAEQPYRGQIPWDGVYLFGETNAASPRAIRAATTGWLRKH